jgi:D-alanyl-D-alanine carboxypeptidase
MASNPGFAYHGPMKRIRSPVWFILFAVFWTNHGQAADSAAISEISDPVWASMQGVSWHRSLPCPKRGDLRVVQVPFIDFSGNRTSGPLVVDAGLAAEVLAIFTEIADSGTYRIEQVALIDAFGGDDFRSIEANNTSAFNCRLTTGAKTMSAHARGRAIDLNPLINPYVDKSGTSHRKSRGFVTRQQRAASTAAGMIKSDSLVVKTFRKYGWSWGGDWSSIKDYQHFSKDGR